MASVTKSNSSYTGEDIEVLEGLEPVRRRPSMYIGGVDSRGLHHLLWEIVDNSVDEFLAGECDRITVTLHKDGSSCTVSDNGRGIPVDKHPKMKKSTLEVILTTLHAGGKFSDKNYARSGGLHGVGSSVVNALSSEMIATVHRDGFEWEQTFRRGKPKGPVEKVKPFRGRGTTIFFRPDEEIFRRTIFNAETIRQHLEVFPGARHTCRLGTEVGQPKGASVAVRPPLPARPAPARLRVALVGAHGVPAGVLHHLRLVRHVVLEAVRVLYGKTAIRFIGPEQGDGAFSHSCIAVLGHRQVLGQNWASTQ